MEFVHLFIWWLMCVYSQLIWDGCVICIWNEVKMIYVHLILKWTSEEDGNKYEKVSNYDSHLHIKEKLKRSKKAPNFWCVQHVFDSTKIQQKKIIKRPWKCEKCTALLVMTFTAFLLYLEILFFLLFFVSFACAYTQPKTNNEEKKQCRKK